MERLSLPSQVQLSHRALFRVPDAAGIEFTCRSGTLWLTLDNDPRDIVLERGERFVTSEHSPALIYALQDSQIAFADAVPQLQRTATAPIRQPLRAVTSLSR